MSRSLWFDYVSQQYVWRDDPPENDAVAQRFVPQAELAQRVYRIRRELGNSVVVAMKDAILGHVGMLGEAIE